MSETNEKKPPVGGDVGSAGWLSSYEAARAELAQAQADCLRSNRPHGVI